MCTALYISVHKIWDLLMCITVVGWSVKHSFSRAVTVFRLVLIVVRVSWTQSWRLQSLTILEGLGGCTMSREAEELVDDFSSSSVASKNAEGIVFG